MAFQQGGGGFGGGYGGGGGFGGRPREMHKATCAECQKECEVPFKPSGDRPVYCKECFAKRKSSGREPAGTEVITSRRDGESALAPRHREGG